MADIIGSRRGSGGGVIVISATSGATDGRTGASRRVFGNLGLDVGLDWCAIESATMLVISTSCARYNDDE